MKRNFTVQSSQNPISPTTKLIFEATFCMCIADPLCTPLLPAQMAFFSTRISRKLESYYYNVKNLVESYIWQHSKIAFKEAALCVVYISVVLLDSKVTEPKQNVIRF